MNIEEKNPSLITFTFSKTFLQRGESEKKEIKTDCFCFLREVFLPKRTAHTAAEREEMLLWEESIHNWNRKTEEQGKENEWAYIEVSPSRYYNVYTSILLVDQSWRCLIHSTERYEHIWENDIRTRAER